MISNLFRSTLFEKSIIKECTHSSLIVFITLLGITLTTVLVRFLGQSASGNLPSESVWVLILLNVLNYLPVLLSLTLFLAILMTVSRSYKESEMIIWQSSGVSLWQWIRPISIFTVPLVLIIATCSLYLTPNLTQKSEIYRQQADSADDTNFVHLGVFRESKDHKTVYFIEGLTGANNTIRNVFVRSTLANNQKELVIFAKHASQHVNERNDIELTLFNGKRYERQFKPNTTQLLDYKVLTFEKYQMIITPTQDNTIAYQSTKSMPTSFLIQMNQPSTHAELAWRVGLPISAIILSLFAILLGFMNPRMAKSLNMFLAVLCYMIYNNLISITQGLVNKQLLSLYSSLILLHGSMLLLLIIFFIYRVYGIKYFKYHIK